MRLLDLVLAAQISRCRGTGGDGAAARENFASNDWLANGCGTRCIIIRVRKKSYWHTDANCRSSQTQRRCEEERKNGAGVLPNSRIQHKTEPLAERYLPGAGSGGRSFNCATHDSGGRRTDRSVSYYLTNPHANFRESKYAGAKGSRSCADVRGRPGMSYKSDSATNMI